MATVDALDIQISTHITKANNAIDKLIDKLGTLSTSLSKINTSNVMQFANGFKDVSDAIKNMDTKLESIGKSMGSLNGQMDKVTKSAESQGKKVGKTLSEINEQYKDLGKGFTIKGDTSQVQKEITKFENTLSKALVKVQKLELSGGTKTKMYENAVAETIKFQNMIDSLKNQLQSMKVETPKLDINFSQVQQAENTLEYFKEKLIEFDNALESNKVNIEDVFPVRGFELQLESLKDKFPQATELIDEYEAELERAKSIVPHIPAIKYEPIDLDAFTQTDNAIDNTRQKMKEFQLMLSNLKAPPINETNINKLNTALTRAENNVDKLRIQLENKITAGEIADDIDDSGFRKMKIAITMAMLEAQALRDRIEEVQNASNNVTGTGFENLKNSFSTLSADAKKFSTSFTKLQSTLTKFTNGVKSAISKVAGLGKELRKTTSASNGGNMSFKSGLTTVLKYGFGIRSFYILFNKLRKAIVDGFQNLAVYSDGTRANMNMLSSSLSTLKNSLAAMVSPIFNAIAPDLNSLIQILIKATNVVNQFFSAMTGRSTWTKAQEVMSDTGKSAKKAGKEIQSAVRSFDELKVINLPDSSGGDTDASGGGFEEVPIEQPISDFAKKVKDIMSKLFDPIKQAWDSVGQDVMNAWKTALSEIGKAITSVGKDFLAVWQQPETVKIFEDLLGIIADIGLIVANLAKNFRKAWEENGTGKAILEGIRDILAIIISHIKSAMDYTVEWSKNIDFSPLLTKIEEWIVSLQPVFDTLAGIIEDFYEEVLLKLAKWTLEKGLPDLIQVFIDFNNKVDWDSLRERLAEFWSHLEPFAETVGEGLILFIERVSDAVANFINSESFDNFLKSIENWMDNVKPEDVADGIQNLAKAFVAVKVAILGFNAIKGIVTIGSTILNFGKLLVSSGAFLKNAGGIIKDVLQYVIIPAIKSFGSKIATLFTGTILPALQSAWSAIVGFFSTFGTTILKALGGVAAAIAAAIAGWNFGQWIYEKIFGEEIDMSFGEQMKEIFSAFTDGTITDAIKMMWDDLTDWLADNVITPIADFFKDLTSKIKKFFSNLWTNIKNIWSKASGWFNDHVITPIVNFFTNLRDKIKDAFEKAWNLAKNVWSVVSNWFKTNILTPISNTFTNVKNNIHNAFQNAWNLITNIWSNAKEWFSKTLNNVKDLFTGKKGIKETIQDAFKDAYEFIKKTFSQIGTFFKGIANDIIKPIGNAVNGIIKGLNWVLSKVGSKTTIGEWTVPQFAKGTDGLPRDTVGIVNDQKGATYREMIVPPNGKPFIPKGRNVMLPMVKGTKIMPADETKKFIQTMPHFAGGIGSFFSGIAESVKSFTGDILDYIAEPAKAVQIAFGKFVDTSSMGGNLAEIAKGAMSTVFDSATEFIKKIFDSTGSAKVESAIRWALGIANDNRHGYDQANRWGPDYDCSSLVISAFQQAGIGLKTAGATYTGNMLSAALSQGFKNVIKSVNTATQAGLKRGDILLNQQHHTGIYLGNGQIVQASSNEHGGVVGGKTGDQTGREIWTRSYYNYPWDAVLRLAKFKEGFGKINFADFKIKGYAMGGFPQPYSIFAAGEGGRTEMLGTVGGKSAVAGNAEITGIKDAIQSTSAEERQLLREQNQLLRQLLQKETGISYSDVGRATQKWARETFHRTGRQPLAF